MNEELIRQCAAEVAFPDTGELAIRLYHARAVAPLVEAVKAYQNAVRVYTMPIAGHMGVTDEPARNLREALAPFQQEAPDAAD